MTNVVIVDLIISLLWHQIRKQKVGTDFSLEAPFILRGLCVNTKLLQLPLGRARSDHQLSGSRYATKVLFKCLCLCSLSSNSNFPACWPRLSSAANTNSFWLSEVSFSTCHALHQYLLSFYYVLDTGDSVLNKTNVTEIYNPVSCTDYKIVLQVIHAELQIMMNARKKSYNLLWYIEMSSFFLRKELKHA